MTFLQKPWNQLTIDGLHRLAGRARGERLHIAECPSTAKWRLRPAQTLTSAELNQRITNFSRQIRAMGIKPGDAVMIYLPLIADAVVAIVGTMAAGAIPCPVSIGLSESELERAAAAVAPRAVITIARHEDIETAAIASRIAFRHFGIRAVAAFGDVRSEGVMALDTWVPDHCDVPEQDRNASPGGVALITVDPHGEAFMAHRRTHSQLICDALALSSTARVSRASPLVSTISATSAIGVIVACVLPALTGAPLHIHGVFNAAGLAAQIGSLVEPYVVVPGAIEPALDEFAARLNIGLGTPLLVHRLTAATESPAFLPAVNRRVVDISCFGETAICAAVRTTSVRRAEFAGIIQHPAAFAIEKDNPWLEMAVDAEGEIIVRGPALSFTAGDAPAFAWRATGLAGRQAKPSGAITVGARHQPLPAAAA